MSFDSSFSNAPIARADTPDKRANSPRVIDSIARAARHWVGVGIMSCEYLARHALATQLANSFIPR